jgi:hypothetical protein
MVIGIPALREHRINFRRAIRVAQRKQNRTCTPRSPRGPVWREMIALQSKRNYLSARTVIPSPVISAAILTHYTV